MRVSAGALLCGLFLALSASPLVAAQAPVTVEFLGETQAQWEVVPSRRFITVSRGEVFETEFTIRNKSGREVLLEVLKEFGPPGADNAIVHLGCGTSFSLILKPGEAAAVPGTYFVAENAPENIRAFNMSYSVYSFEALGPDPRQVGRQVYTARCLSCHGRQGRGDGPIARFLAGGVGDLTPALRQKADRSLLDAIASGMGPMPAYAAVLTAEEQQGLLLHLRDMGRGAP